MSVTLETAQAAPVTPTPSRLLVTVRRQADPTYRPLGFLSYEDEVYTFAYLRSALRSNEFRPLPGLSSHPSLPFRSPRLFPLFTERVMSSRRPDRESSLRALALPVGAAPFEVLARSGGRRTGDTLELLAVPRAAADGALTVDFPVHGVRHTPGASERIGLLSEGDLLLVRPDPANPVNPRARVVLDGTDAPLGWVPDPLLEVVEHVLDLELRVLRANGPEVGAHLRLLVSMSGRLPPDDQPFDGPEWRTVLDT